MLFTTSLTVIGLASGAGSGKIARDLGNEALTRLSKELGVSLDVVLNSATKVAKDEYDISTLSDITRLYSEGKLKLSVFVGRVNVVVKSSDEYVQAVAAKYSLKLPTDEILNLKTLDGFNSSYPVWTKTSSLTTEQNIAGHWIKHATEFPTIRSTQI